MIEYRRAVSADKDEIVGLHVTESQRAYAGILPQQYLSLTLPQEKQRLWEDRFCGPQDGHSIHVAHHRTSLAGFCCFLFGEQTEFGTYLHNLFVSSSFHGNGVAKKLLGQAISEFDEARKERPIHLLVFKENANAVAVYEKLGGSMIERIDADAHDSALADVLRYQWNSASSLLASITA